MNLNISNTTLGDLFSLGSASLWSIAVIMMRLVGFHVKVLPFNIFKNAIATLGFFLVVLLMGEPLIPDLTIKEWLTLTLSGVLGICLADIFFVASLNRLGASLQAIVDCIYAPSVILTAYILFRETVSIQEVVGGTLVGTAILIGATSSPEVKSKKDLIFGLTFGASAHILMAIGALIARDIYREHSVVWVCGYRFLISNIILIVYGTFFYNRKDLWSGFTTKGAYFYSYGSAILGSFLATLCWLSGFKYTEAGRAAIYNQMSSVLIAILGIIILREKLTSRKVLGILMGVAGGIVISLSSSKI
ncbi:MAG: DMT family transporter [Bdellovibrionales bacterium]|nr:DMT family transporter [Bdellovibrionales bacterium]